MEKLISMTDFVLEQSKLTGYDISDYDWIIRIVNYAKFLKQPLKLEMFVPCDDGGNVLEHPIYTTNHSDECYCKGCEEETKRCSDLQDQYQKAKEKVLFEGFEVKRNYIMYYDFMYMMTYELENKNIESIIEKIPNNTLTLTENALKQFL